MEETLDRIRSRFQELIKNEKDPKRKAGWMKEWKLWEKMIEKQAYSQSHKTRTGYKSFKPTVSPGWR